MVYDQKTKQKRYMSPFDQFLAQQHELFQKESTEGGRMHDEENSVTMTTTASTLFEQKLSPAPLTLTLEANPSSS